MYSDTDKLKIKPGVPWQQDGERALILDADESYAHELNSSALFIWKNLSEEMSYKNLLEQFIQEFESDEKTLEADLKIILDQFEQLKLISVCSNE